MNARGAEQHAHTRRGGRRRRQSQLSGGEHTPFKTRARAALREGGGARGGARTALPVEEVKAGQELGGRAESVRLQADGAGALVNVPEQRATFRGAGGG